MGNQSRTNTKRAKRPQRISKKSAMAPSDTGGPWIDPYLLWAMETNFRDFPRMSDWYPIALGLSTTAEAFARKIREDDFLRTWIQVATPYTNPPQGLEDTKFCTAFVQRHVLLNPDKLRELASASGTTVERLQLGLPRKLNTSLTGFDDLPFEGTPDGAALAMLNSIGSANRRADSANATVFVGIIDDGIAFAQQRFRTSQGLSRVEYFWDQGAVALSGPPGTYGYGRVFTKPDIDALIAASTNAGFVDEDDLYRRAGQSMASPVGATLMRARGHGTHVLDQAAGEHPPRWTPATPGIVAVQLPDRTARDTSGASLVTNALDGIRFIIDSVQKLARERNLHRPSIVINLSYGSIAGPHDGTSLLEAAMDEIASLYNADPGNGHLAIVLPAGNHRHSRCHASMRVESAETRTLHWRILPDDATPSFMEIWLPGDLSAEALAALSVQVKSPTGLQGKPVGFNKTQEMVLTRTTPSGADTSTQDGTDLKELVYFKISFTRPSQGSAPMFLLALAPTVIHDYSPTDFEDDGPTADSGTWTIEIHNDGTESVQIEAWIQRDDSLIGRPKIGRQSRFADPAYQRYDEMGRLNEIDADDAYCKRAGTINALATGQMPIVVGGFNRLLREVADYSGSGPCRPPPEGVARPGADVLARSDISSLRHGLRGAGTRSGSIFWMNGTSVSAPLVTRWIAAQLGRSGATPNGGVPPAREMVVRLAPKLAVGKAIPGHAARPKPTPGTVQVPMLDLPAPRHFTPDAGAGFRATSTRRRQR